MQVRTHGQKLLFDARTACHLARDDATLGRKFLQPVDKLLALKKQRAARALLRLAVAEDACQFSQLLRLVRIVANSVTILATNEATDRATPASPVS